MCAIKITEINEKNLYEVSGNYVTGGYGYTAGAIANQHGVAVSAGSGSTASFSYTGFDSGGYPFSLSFAF